MTVEDLQNNNLNEIKLITSPCARFLEENRNLALFVSRSLSNAEAFDKIVTIILKTLPSLEEEIRKMYHNPEQKASLGEEVVMLMRTFIEGQKSGEIVNVLGESRTEMANIVITHKQLFLELLLSRAVDNFLVYISELLALIYRTRPETLKSTETEKLEFILQYDTMPDLIAALAEKRVNEQAYMGIQKLSDELSKRLGFSLFEQSEESDRVIKIIEMRNIIVHNRAIINERFLSRVRNFSMKAGEKVVLAFPTVLNDITFLSQIVKIIDTQASNKFKLPTPIEKNPLS